MAKRILLSRACLYPALNLRCFASDVKPKDGLSPSVSATELLHYKKLANTWWDPAGPFQPLHAMNPARCKFIRDFACSRFGLEDLKPNTLEGLKVLDVGCGGGILSEAIARMGATVLGIDVVDESIEVARGHVLGDPLLKSKLRYEVTSAEDLAMKGETFDILVASEVIEHVKDPRALFKVLGALTHPDGVAIISTLNRTPQAYLVAILGAEQLLRVIPKGTHDWKQFITPEEMVMIADDAGLKMEQMAGMMYNPWSKQWSMGRNVSVNYIAGFVKVGKEPTKQPVSQTP